MFWESVAYAMGAGGGGQAPSTGFDQIISFVPLLLVLVIFYLLLYRPQQKKAKEQKELLTNLRKGDYVLCSGFYGRIIEINEDIITLEVAKDVQLRVNRNYILGLAEPPHKEKKEKEKAADE